MTRRKGRRVVGTGLHVLLIPSTQPVTVHGYPPLGLAESTRNWRVKKPLALGGLPYGDLQTHVAIGDHGVISLR